MACKVLFNGKEYPQDTFLKDVLAGRIDVPDEAKKVIYEAYGKKYHPKIEADDVSSENPYGEYRFKNMPFKFSGAKIAAGEKTISVRSETHNSGTYSDPVSGNLINVINQGKMLISDFLKKTGMSQKDFIKKFIGTEEVKYQHIQDFLEGKEAMNIYSVEKMQSYDDIIPEMDDPRYALQLDKRLKLLTKLNKQLRLEKDHTKKEDIRSRIESIQKQVNALKDDDSRNLASMVSFMSSDIAAVEKMLSGNPDKKALEYGLSLLYNYTNILAANFKDIIDLLPKDGDDTILTYGKVLEYLDKAESLSKNIRKELLSMPARLVSRLTGKNISEIMVNGIATDTSDLNAIARYVYDGTESSNAIMQTIAKVIKDSFFKGAASVKSFIANFKDVSKEFDSYQKASGLKKSQYFDFMIQEDADGKRTKYIVDKLSVDYWRARNAASGMDKLLFYAKNHKFKINAKAWDARQARLIGWYKANRAEDALGDDNDPIVYNNRLDQMAQKFADSRNPYTAAKVLKKALNTPRAITKAELKFFIRFEKNGGLRAEYIDGERIKPMEEVANAQWRDIKYDSIQSLSNDDPRKKYFDFYTSKLSEFRHMRSEEENFLAWNFIPQMTKDLGVGGNLSQTWTDSIAQNVYGSNKGINDLTGEVDREIPTYMLNDSLSPENRSYDLHTIMQKFAKETLEYVQKRDIEDDANMLLALVKEQKVPLTNPDGTAKMDNSGQPMYKEGNSNIFEMAKYRVNAYLYDDRQDKELVSKARKLDVLDKRELDQIRKDIKELNVSDDEKGIVLESIALGVPYTGNNPDAAKYMQLIMRAKEINLGAKYITGNKVVNTLMSFTSLRVLGFNLFSGVAECLQGLSALATEGAAGKFFTGNNAVKALGHVMASMNPFDKHTKVNNIEKYFNVFSHDFYDTNKSGLLSTINKVGFAPWEFANKISNTTILVAMLDHEKISDESDNEHSLFDIMDLDQYGKFTVADGFKNPFYDKDGEYSDYLLSLHHRFKEVLKNTRERSAMEDPAPIERTMVGRLLGQFKKNWFFRGLYYRFGDYREETLLYGSEFKGFYKSWLELFKLPTKTDEFGEEVRDASITGFAKMALNLIKNWYTFSAVGKLTGAKPENMSELDEENLRRFMRETSIIIVAGIVMLGLSSMGGGDSDDDKTRKYFVNQLRRMYRDLTTYMDPGSFASIMKNPFPVTSTITDLLHVGDAIIQSTVFLDPTTAKGNLRIWQATKKNIPLVNQIDRTINKFEKTLTYSGY